MGEVRRISGGSGTGTGWDGQVQFRADLPIVLGNPAIGDVWLVEDPTTILLGIWTTYQSGLYIRDFNNGNLNDWRRLNVKVKFSDSEFAVVSVGDQSKQGKFDLSLVTTSTTRTVTWQDKDGTMALISDIAAHDLSAVLASGKIATPNDILMRLQAIKFGGTDLVSIMEDGGGGMEMLNNSGAFSSWAMIVQDGTTLGRFALGFVTALYEQTGLLATGKIKLNFGLQDPSIDLESDQLSGGKKHTVQGINPTQDNLHLLQNKNGTIAHIGDLGIEGFFLEAKGSFGTGGGWADNGFIGNLPVLFYAQNVTERAVFMFYGIARAKFDAVDPVVLFAIYSNGAPVVTTGDDVEWELSARYRAEGEAVTGAADETLTQTQTLTTIGADTRQDNLAFTLDRSKIINGEYIHLILRRLGGDANDTYADDVSVGQSGINVQTLKHNP